MKNGVVVIALLGASASVRAQPACPKDITDAIARSYPTAGLVACEPTSIDGRALFAARIQTFDHPDRDLELSPDGQILSVGEQVPASQLPGVVLDAFDTRFPGVRPTLVERVETVHGITYELSFPVCRGVRHATFTEDGVLLRQATR